MRTWKQLSCYTLAVMALTGCQSSTWNRVSRFGRGPSEAERVEQLIEEARDLEVDGKIAEARAAYMDILAASPENKLASQRLELLKQYAPLESELTNVAQAETTQQTAQANAKLLLANTPVVKPIEAEKPVFNLTSQVSSAEQTMVDQAESQWKELDQFLAIQKQKPDAQPVVTSNETVTATTDPSLPWATAFSEKPASQPQQSKARLLIAQQPEVNTEPDFEFDFETRTDEVAQTTSEPKKDDVPAVETAVAQQPQQTLNSDVPDWAAEWGNQESASPQLAQSKPSTTPAQSTESGKTDASVDAFANADEVAQTEPTSDTPARNDKSTPSVSTIEMAARQTNPVSRMITPPDVSSLTANQKFVQEAQVTTQSEPFIAANDTDGQEPNPFAQTENFMTWLPLPTQAGDTSQGEVDASALATSEAHSDPALSPTTGTNASAKLVLTSTQATSPSVVRLSNLTPSLTAPEEVAETSVASDSASEVTASNNVDQSLLSDLQSSDDRKRREAIDTVASLGAQATAYQSTLEQIIQQGTDVDQICAAWALLKITGYSTDSVAVLEQSLESERSDLVQLGAYLIGDAGFENSTTQLQLTTLLRNTDPLVRLHAAEALLKLDDSHPEAIEALFDLLDESDFRSKWLAAHALSEAQGTSARIVVARLIRTLKEADPKTKSAAALSLGSFGQLAYPAKVELLKMRVSTDEDLRFAAETALACIKDNK